MASKKRSPAEAWSALEKQAREDEIERFLALPSSEVDARLRAAGHDPAAVRAEGVALAKTLSAARERLAWQAAAAAGLAEAQARFAARTAQTRKYAGLSRGELEKLVTAAQRSPRFAQPVAVMFRNRKTEEASEEELRAILEEIDALEESERGSGGAGT
jgi:hypothetical protein